MTLIVTINGCESIWMLADRRLSFPGKNFKDNARKIAFLETLDGVGIIGYAGLGATSKGTEPSDWVASVLRGRKMKLEQSLGVLAGAMERQFKKHMMKIPKEYLAVHSFIVPSIVDEEVKVYAIEMLLSKDRKAHKFQFIQVSTGKDKKRPYRFNFGGSGGEVLKKDKTWIIKLLRLVRNYDKGRVTAHTVVWCPILMLYYKLI